MTRALEPRSAERYANVDALADDLRRYLNREPVLAHPKSLRYSVLKFVTRHSRTAALTGLAVAAVIVGAAVSLLQWRSAAEQRDFALRQLSRAEAVNELNVYLISDAAPEGKPFTAGDLLERAEDVVDTQYRDDADNRVEMLIAIGHQHYVQETNTKARAVLSRAYRLATTTSDRTLRAKAACALASVVANAGDAEGAEALLSEAKQELAAGSQYLPQRIFCLLDGSEVARTRGDSGLAIARAQSALQLLEQSPMPSVILRVRAATALAESYRVADRPRQAAAAFEDAWRRTVWLGRDRTEAASTLLNNWAMTHFDLGQPLRAEPLFRRALELESPGRSEAGVSPMLLNNLARVRFELGDYQEATVLAERAYELAIRGGNEVCTHQNLLLRSDIYREQGDLARAAAVLAELTARSADKRPANPIALAALSGRQALLASAHTQHAGAIALATSAIASVEAHGRSAIYLARFLLYRARILLAAGRVVDAEGDARRVLDLEQALAGPAAHSSKAGRASLVLAQALAAQDQPTAAMAACRWALRTLEATLGADHPDTRSARLGCRMLQ